MAEIIARFADGRLLVQEDKAVETGTISGGYMSFRVAHVRTIEKVLSIDAAMSGHPDEKIATELRDVAISGDLLRVQLRRADLGVPVMARTLIMTSANISGFTRVILSGLQGFTSGFPIFDTQANFGSGTASLSRLSGVTSGLGYYDTVCSTALVSGILKIVANVIGY